MKHKFLIILICFSQTINVSFGQISTPKSSTMSSTAAVFNTDLQMVKVGASLQGSIVMDDNIYNEMAEAIGGVNPEDRVVKVEVYNYLYAKDPDKPGKTRLYLTNKEEGVQVSYSKQTGGITFTLKNVPVGKYAVVAYFTSIPAQYSSAVITDRCERENRWLSISSIRSNARTRIPGVVAYGIYTVNTNEVSPISFSANFKRADGLMAVGIIDDIGDFLGDAADFLGDALESVGGVVVSIAGTIVVTIGTTVITLIQSGELPKFRTMAQSEYDWANDLFFNGTLPSRSTIIITNLMSIKRRAYVIPTGLGQILMNLGTGYENPREHNSPEYQFKGRLFIHELTHVWQIHHNSLLHSWKEGVSNQWENTVMGDKNIYKPDKNAGWIANNYEQQAAIADECFTSIYNTPSKRCGWQEDMIVQNIRNGNRFPFVATSVKETALEHTGNKIIYGSVEWSYLNVAYPSNTNPDDVFEITITAPFKKTETVNNCDGTGLGNSAFTDFRKLAVPVEIYSPQSIPSNDVREAPTQMSCGFKIANLPEGVPLYMTVSNKADWQPGTMSRKPEGRQTVFSVWVESTGSVEVKPYIDPKFYIKGGYGPVAPDQIIKNGINIKKMQTDGPINTIDLENKQIKTPASTAPSIKKTGIIKN